MRKLIVVLIAVLLSFPISAQPNAKDFGVPDNGQGWVPKNRGDLKRTPEQFNLQCRVTGQIARGLASVMEMAAHLQGEIPPKQFMNSYIMNFYQQKDRLDRLAIPLAVEAINWIYMMKPPVNQHYNIGFAVEADCKNNWEMYNKAKREVEGEAKVPVPVIDPDQPTWSA